MSKKKKRKKFIASNVSSGFGVYYAQKKCDICKKLLWGSSEKDHREAERGLRQRLKAHREECQGEKISG